MLVYRLILSINVNCCLQLPQKLETNENIPRAFENFPYKCPQISTYFYTFSYILSVPFGPRFDLRTSCSPLAALMLTASAWAALATSAFGLSDFTADMFVYVAYVGSSPSLYWYRSREILNDLYLAIFRCQSLDISTFTLFTTKNIHQQQNNLKSIIFITSFVISQRLIPIGIAIGRIIVRTWYEPDHGVLQICYITKWPKRCILKVIFSK